jgi:multidrug efflux pump subunit AcrA (membrane-fusion protein)
MDARPATVARMAMVAAMAAGLLVQPESAGAEARATASGMAATVTLSSRVCFRDVIRVTGTVVARNEILVRPDREGLQISQIFVEVGQSVSSGQILARLAPPPGQTGVSAPVRAPASGIVTAAPTVTGVMASARGDPLFRIVANGELELAAEVTGKQLGKLSTGQSAKIRIAGMDELAGRVRLVAHAIDPMLQLAEVRIFIGSNPRLRLGAFGSAMVDVGQSCGVAVPMSAVLYGRDGAVVQVVREGRIETRRVTIGLITADTIEIRDGVADGEAVIVRAGAFLREGDRIRPFVARRPSDAK